jgi:hypothetical protein
VRLAVQRRDDDPPHGLELDLVRALLERVAELGRRGRLEEVIVDDGVACGGGVHGGQEGIGRGGVAYAGDDWARSRGSGRWRQGRGITRMKSELRIEGWMDVYD